MTATRKKTLPQHDPDFLRKIGRKGGRATKQREYTVVDTDASGKTVKRKLKGRAYFSYIARRSHPKNNPEAQRDTYDNGGRKAKK